MVTRWPSWLIVGIAHTIERFVPVERVGTVLAFFRLASCFVADFGPVKCVTWQGNL